jgi:hypothetical protein
LSTILRRSLRPIIFLINNNGYTIERLILGSGSSYNDINQWRYADAASFFDTQDQAIAYRVRTEDELENALAAARDREALVLIELVMSRLDAPGPLVNFAQSLTTPNSHQFRNAPSSEQIVKVEFEARLILLRDHVQLMGRRVTCLVFGRSEVQNDNP